MLTAFADTVEDPEDEMVALMSGIAAHIGQFVERRLVEDLQRQLARSKNEYLALVGHELRTPLTVDQRVHRDPAGERPGRRSPPTARRCWR